MGPLTRRVVRGMEDRLGVDLPYLHHMAATRRTDLIRLGLFLAASAPRSGIPKRALHLAVLGATAEQDCGECVQIAVNLALADGVPAEVLLTALGRRDDAMDPADADALAFGRAVTRSDADADPLREVLRARYGDPGVQELALGVGFAQFFPVLKRGLGFARSCSLVGVDVGPA
ncbi:MAG: hypothetical protein RH859_00460 [Longimicrobiales bacterium]